MKESLIKLTRTNVTRKYNYKLLCKIIISLNVTKKKEKKKRSRHTFRKRCIVS